MLVLRMIPLTCRNIDLGGSGYTSNRCGSIREYSKVVYTSAIRGGGGGYSARKLVSCKSNDSRCEALSAQTSPEAIFNMVISDPTSALDLNLKSSEPISVSSLVEVVADDLEILNKNLQTIVGAENPVLLSAAEQIFSAGGKRLRPALVFLVSRATAELAGLKELTSQHKRLAEIIEMIHTASLIHDDVLDDSGTRRGMHVHSFMNK
ncbi:hypothetical protein GIB67_034873 [Kingdonia uniflora]|uniref:Uncharacterized protein n=1 Tax=Kingdonia uniflora TaxID=39325 RepID=A0A7J7ME54_9MAGN|nr:hypothetical protein GIB67_034873 [Kingdonia uniflora]